MDTKEVLDYFMLPLQEYNPEPTIIDGHKPLLLILTQDYSKHLDFNGLPKPNKSPLATLFYEYLARDDGAFEVVFETNQIASIKEIVEKKLGGIKPDFVLYGYTFHYGILVDHEYMMDNDIKFIYTIGDIECTMNNGLATEILDKVKIDFLLNNLKDDITDLVVNFPKIGYSKVLYVPWAIDEKHYPDKRKERDIELAFICSFDDSVVFHEKRSEMLTILENLSRKYKLKLKAGQYFGEEYIDILNRSKIFVVEPSMRGAMVQKYLEGPLCGSMIVGEIPKHTTIFNDDTIIPFNISLLLYYLKNDSKREIIAKKCKDAVLENYHISKIAKKYFEEALIA